MDLNVGIRDNSVLPQYSKQEIDTPKGYAPEVLQAAGVIEHSFHKIE